jgi:Cys-rich protein (TIGR01571 family)
MLHALHRPLTPFAPKSTQLTFKTITGAEGDDETDMGETKLVTKQTKSDAPDVPPATRAWAAGLCSCLSYPGSCLSTVFCNPCVTAQVLDIASGGRKYLCLVTGIAITILVILMVIFQNIENDDTMVVGTILSVTLSIFTFAVLLYARSVVRKREGIKGSAIGDCCASFFCTACGLCQILNQYAPYRGFWSSYEVLDESTAATAV